MNNPVHSKLQLTRLFYTLFAALVIGLVSACGGGDSKKDKTTDPRLSLDSPSILEGDSDSSDLVFTLTLSETASSDLTVTYSTADGSATEADNDYTVSSGQATISSGSDSTTISIPVTGDEHYEDDETVTLNISDPQGPTVTNTTLNSSGTIINDDAFISISEPRVNEGDSGTSLLTFTISLPWDATDTLSFDYATSDDSAEAGTDYGADSGNVSITTGNRSVEVSIDINGDTDFEHDESFNFTVNNLQGADVPAAGLSFQSEGTIANDEPAQAGYFAGGGTLNGTEYNDLTSLVYGNRILMFSPTANVLYDIDTTNNNTGEGYSDTGNVDVYVDGQLAQTVDSTGSINAFELSGSISNGTGFGVGSFTVTYDQGNNTGATLARIEATGLDKWTGNLYGIDLDTGVFVSDNNGEYGGTDSSVELCAYSPTTDIYLGIPDANVNIYQLAHAIEDQAFNYCQPPYASTGHTGFAAVIDDDDTSDGGDDKLLFAFDNGEIAQFAIMYRPN